MIRAGVLPVKSIVLTNLPLLQAAGKKAGGIFVVNGVALDMVLQCFCTKWRSAGHKENPETVAVSGFLKFDMRDRLSLGAVIRHVKTVFLRENRGVE